jgi:hypothetical protein
MVLFQILVALGACHRHGILAWGMSRSRFKWERTFHRASNDNAANLKRTVDQMQKHFGRFNQDNTSLLQRPILQTRGFIDESMRSMSASIGLYSDAVYKKTYEQLEALLPNLTAAEKHFVRQHPVEALNFIGNAAIALNWTAQCFAEETLHNGSGDAFRHCLWSAMNASAHGVVLAKMFGDAHEAFGWNPPDEMAMDKHNNGVGFQLGAPLRYATPWRLATLCGQAWSEGRLVQINAKKSSDLKYEGAVGKFLYGKQKP